METSNSDAENMDFASPSSPSNGGGTIYGFLQSRAMRFLQSPIASLIEYSGVVLQYRADYPYPEAHPLIPAESTSTSSDVQNPGSGNRVDGEVSIRIIGEHDRVEGDNGENGIGADEPLIVGGDVNGNGRGDNSNDDSNNNREASSHQRYDIQQAARWLEQVLPFSLLLLIVFVRQHLQGFVVTLYSIAVLLKSNDVLQKQTALKGERKIAVLVGYFIFLTLHVIGVYWLNWGDDLSYPLLMIPPKIIPPFWHAIFIILVNDIMARQTAMILKLALLMYYKNGKGHNFRRQGQMLTLVEYTLVVYRGLLPTPVWYRFFLNKDYGSLFSSLTTGFYLTLKLTSIIEKARSFFSALKALSKKEVHYGSHATPEQVGAAGDLCAICQEKMQTPILLRCKHIFCEDCVSEWFERERSCPLCRAVVRPADLKSYGDGSTSLYFQLF